MGLHLRDTLNQLTPEEQLSLLHGHIESKRNYLSITPKMSTKEYARTIFGLLKVMRTLEGDDGQYYRLVGYASYLTGGKEETFLNYRNENGKPLGTKPNVFGNYDSKYVEIKELSLSLPDFIIDEATDEVTLYANQGTFVNPIVLVEESKPI